MKRANKLTSAPARCLACGQCTISDTCYYTPSLSCTVGDLTAAESTTSPELESEITLAVLMSHITQVKESWGKVPKALPCFLSTCVTYMQNTKMLSCEGKASFIIFISALKRKNLLGKTFNKHKIRTLK